MDPLIQEVPVDRRKFVGTTAAYFIASALAAACGGSSTSPTSPTGSPAGGGGVGGGATGGTGGQAGITIAGSNVSVNIAQAGIANPGQFVILGGADAIVVNVGTGYVALSKTCTHSGCDLARFNAASSLLECDCHGSRFRTNGQVANGPAAAPLRTYATTVNAGVVSFSV
jgi:cytochrome b6-f complex iron-sulfur subunit